MDKVRSSTFHNEAVQLTAYALLNETDQNRYTSIRFVQRNVPSFRLSYKQNKKKVKKNSLFNEFTDEPAYCISITGSIK